MKLIFCPECCDVRGLRKALERVTCHCGKSSGIVAADHLTATLSGLAIPMGFANNSFIKALHTRPSSGMGSNFTAFVIPSECDTVRYEDI